MFTKFALASLLALTTFAKDNPKTIPLSPADQSRFAGILEQSRSLSQELDNMRLRACLASKLTLEQCGPVNADGTVQVLEPKPVEPPKADAPKQ